MHPRPRQDARSRDTSLHRRRGEYKSIHREPAASATAAWSRVFYAGLVLHFARHGWQIRLSESGTLSISPRARDRVRGNKRGTSNAGQARRGCSLRALSAALFLSRAPADCFSYHRRNCPRARESADPKTRIGSGAAVPSVKSQKVPATGRAMDPRTGR